MTLPAVPPPTQHASLLQWISEMRLFSSPSMKFVGQVLFVLLSIAFLGIPVLIAYRRGMKAGKTQATVAA